MGDATDSRIDAFLGQARAQFQDGKLEEATAMTRGALEIDRQCAEALHLLGLIAFRQGKFVSAEDLLRIAISHNRSASNYYCNLAQVLSATGRTEEAIDFCRRGLAIREDDHESHFIFGKVLRTAGRVDEARQAYERCIQLRADFAPAHVNLGMLQLLNGDFDRGWRELEWRWDRPDTRKLRQRFTKPRWDGSPFPGQRILLFAEQGLNDTIQFCRYAPLVAQEGLKVILQVHPELTRLLRSLKGIAEVHVSNIAPAPADLQCPLISLPFVLKTNASTIPADVPYLTPDARDVQAWRSRIDSLPHKPMLDIGIVGFGTSRPQPAGSALLSLEAVMEIAREREDARWFVLDGGDAAAFKNAANPTGRLIDWTSDLKDLADTAALLENLSLVITHDSTIAHLAGAMGKPVWLLLPTLSDWRWMLDRPDSPWYPTMRIFRQRSADSWEQPLREMAQHLKEGRL